MNAYQVSSAFELLWVKISFQVVVFCSENLKKKESENKSHIDIEVNISSFSVTYFSNVYFITADTMIAYHLLPFFICRSRLTNRFCEYQNKIEYFILHAESQTMNSKICLLQAYAFEFFC